MTIRSAVWLALAALALSACATKSTPSGPALEGRLTALRWTLQSATDGQGQPIAALFPRADPRFTVEFKDGRVGIRGGCNAMGGNYQIDAANQLQVGPMMSTRMACADGLMEADHALSALLAQRLRVQLDESPAPTLRLVSADGQTLVWAGVPAP
ncbi:META domain-containing protein [Rhodoferax sp.]|uniref:META domain-containing protein n=1 Tax=Rhodoferax sp. TaxID=50421 RepID=UPI0025FD1B9D|nr:META domain-containing protein [Rhodoferax sp.]